ncbi:hypothetical protein DASB73_019320 [Starmerella bacillaris]|uniref:Uncharacterized protein n=1 Tax=Starmerella bacillaris TaxID=1247836 RepID=A0AAV5RK84_STABA|nr:hypothetical protein DASB73_019320 [Starmerella bacillaris]
MWSRLKGQLRGHEEKDNDENDTILSRALLRYYAPEVPSWLAASAPYVETDQTRHEYKRANMSHRARVFERTESFSAHAVSSTSGVIRSGATAGARIVTKPTSGLASRLKNTHW